jgi:phosphoesterase RecJ-like protein
MDVLERIKNSNKILIIPDGSRVDWDCIGTSLAIRSWLKQLGKEEVNIYVFSKIPKSFSTFPGIEIVQSKYINEVLFDYYDLIILVDTNEWARLLTKDYTKVLENVDKKKFINIDHHEGGDFEHDPDIQVLSKKASASAKVFYDFLYQPSGIDLNLETATYLYHALLSDTQAFRVAMYADTFSFAEKLIKAGVDHYDVLERFLSIPKAAIDFLILAIEKTKYYEDLGITTLVIDNDMMERIDKEIGGEWITEDYNEYYKEMFMRRVTGYNYGIIFREDFSTAGSRFTWRTRNNGVPIDIMDTLNSIKGFKAGGHKGAGGGYTTLSPKMAEERFIETLRQHSKKEL